MERTVREELSALKEAQESNAAMIEFLGRAVRVNAEIQKQAAAMRACMERVEAGMSCSEMILFTFSAISLLSIVLISSESALGSSEIMSAISIGDKWLNIWAILSMFVV